MTTPKKRRIAASVAGAAALITTVLTAGAPTATAVPGVPAASFDTTSVDWNSWRDQSSAAFSSTFTTMKNAGQLPVDIDIETAGGYAVGSVWQKNLGGRAWTEKRDLSSSAFSAAWQTAVSEGKRLVEQETYVVDGQRRYAGIWIENKEGLGWASHRGQTNAQFVASFNAHRDAGMMPIDYDEYATIDGLRYNSVWVQRPSTTGWALYRGLTSSGFSQKFSELSSDYRVLSFDSLHVGSTQRYAGIWIENENGRGWAAKRDMNLTSYLNNWYRYRDLGYRVVGFNRYQTASGTRYSAIWRQNSSKPNWSLRSAVDNRIAQELANTGVPGVSVAVYQGGVVRYTRGFGYADLGAGVWMDSTHVGSIASVSKAITGTLAERMQEQGLLDLDDATRDWVPSMPVKHTHTVADLLANRGCVRHYVTGLDDQAGKSYATALAAAATIWDDDLVCTPGTGQYNYSTHGYTLAAAALEAAGGDDIKDLFHKLLTTPFGLGTLGAQNFSSSVHRMSLYTDGNAEVDTPNNDWKVAGGGIDSSAADLARFGARLIAGQILNPGSLSEMWTAPDGSAAYGLGWDLGSEDGTQVVAKGGSWTGNLAYLRLYPQKGIVVAVMMNDRSGSQSATQLGRDIGSLVLDSLS
jgi:CubicO group peptidase (beta-lactamase class C family)